MMTAAPIGPSGTLTIGALLDLRAEEIPDAMAVEVRTTDSVATLTYRELRRGARRWAGWMNGRGVTEGDRVVVVSDTSVDLVLVLYAVALTGAVAVPLNTGWLPTEIADAAVRVRPRLLLADSAERLPAAGDGTTCHVLAEIAATLPDEDDGDDAPWAGPSTGAMAPFQILFTSGTTALPKGVVLSHGNCLGGAVQAGVSVGWGRGERFASALPLHHVNAQTFCLWSALVWAGTAVLFPRFSASEFPRRLDEAHVTVTSLVSTQVRTMLLQKSHLTVRPRALRHVVFAINISDEERCALEEAWSVRLRNGYGLTEAMTLVAIEPVWQPIRLWPAIGLPVAGRRLRVVDRTGADCVPGEVGELLVGGTAGVDLMIGYWEDEESTESALADGWLRTGDLVRLGELGELYYVGRVKEVIKVAGENVSAAEVESALLTHPAVLECAVFSLPDPVRDERVAAAVVLRRQATVEALHAHLAGRLASFKRPTVLRVMDQLPRGQIGKIDKRAVRADILEEDA